VLLTVNPPAASFAGTSSTICEGSTYTLSQATAGNYANLLWTSSGTGLFSDAAIKNPVYAPSAADILAGSVTLKLKAFGMTACADVESTVVLTISHQVIATAGLDAIVCQTTPFEVSTAVSQFENTLVWSHNGAGTLSLETSIHPVYTPAATEAGTVTLTLTANPISPCAQVVDQMDLTVNPQATMPSPFILYILPVLTILRPGP
ncbi:hypothetical protein JZU57_01645, partial [bacterium]|nr:hypothetical protein [bacterium]